MKKKYLYNGQILDQTDVEEGAKASNVDVDTYIQKAGMKSIDDSYMYQGNEIPSEDILKAANESKLGFDDYIQKAGFQKKNVGTSLSVGSDGQLQESSPTTSQSQGNGKYTPQDAEKILDAHKDLEWVKRLFDPNAPTIKTNTLKGINPETKVPYSQEPDDEHSTHLMADDGNGYVFPTIVMKPDESKLTHFDTNDDAEAYARKTGTGIQLPKEQGTWFADNGYKLAPNVNNSINANGAVYNNPNYQNNEYANQNPIDLARQSDELSKKTITQSTGNAGEGSGGVLTQPDEEAVAKSKKIDDYLKQQGYDTKQINNLFGDFPQNAYDVPNQNKDQLIAEYKQNPLATENKINNIKTQFALQDAGKQQALETNPTNEDYAENFGRALGNKFNELHTEHITSMPQLYDNIQRQQQLINNNLTGDERYKALERVQNNMSGFLNASVPQMQEEYEASPLKSKLSPDEYSGLQTWKLFDPEKYKQAIDFLKTDVGTAENATKTYNEAVQQQPLDARANMMLYGNIQKTTDRQIAQETIHRQLLDQGRANAYNYLTSQQYDLNSNYDKAQTSDQKNQIADEYFDNQQKINGLKTDAQADDARYPLTAKLKFDNQIKEITGEPGRGIIGTTLSRFDKGFQNSMNSTVDFLTNLFGSDQQNTNLQMLRLGQSQQYQSQNYLPSNLSGADYGLKASKELQDQADQILKGRSVSDLSSQEQDQLRSLVASNPDQITTVSNDKGKNFLSKATAYKVAGFTGDIASFIGQMYMLKGAGLSDKAAELTTLFNGAYSDAYDKATAEGKSPSDANQYAMLHGGVQMLAGLVSSKFENIKNILGTGKSELSKEINGIGEDAWNEITNGSKSWINKIKDASGDILKSNAKNIATFGVGTSIANDLVDKGFFNKKISTDEIVNNAINAGKDMAIGSLALAGTGFISHIANNPVTFADKANIWESGVNPEISKFRIDESVANNTLTKEEGEARKKAIDNVSTLIQKVPARNDRGRLLTDADRVNYLYNSVIKSKAKEATKDLPPKQAEDADMKGNIAEHDNEILLQDPTLKQLQTRKSQLEKTLEPQKDESGKLIELEPKVESDTKAELESVNSAINAHSRAKQLLPSLHGEPSTEENKGEIKPISENIVPTESFRTLEMGKDEGKSETKDARDKMKGRFLDGNIPMDGEDGKGETGRQFVERVISKWNDVKNNEAENTAVVTHSSVLKAIKTWEDLKDKLNLTDPTKMDESQWKQFAKRFNEESTDNGDLETFKGTNGKIHVIRHGETQDNKEHNFRSAETNLTDKGKHQVVDVANELKEKTDGNVPKIITSDLPRSIHSSNIIHNTLNGKENAIQESETGTVLQRQQGETGSAGGERGRVEQGQQGNEPANEGGRKPPINESKESETEGKENTVTGIKKSITDSLRQERGLPQVEVPKMGKDVDNLASAKERVDSGKVNPIEVVNRILDTKEGFKNHEEAFEQQYYAHQLAAKDDELNEKLADAKTEEEKAFIRQQRLQLSDEIDAQTEAMKIAGSMGGKILSSFAPVVDEGFNISREKSFIKDAYGGEIPKDVNDKIAAITKERDDAIAEKKKIEELLKQRAAKEGVSRIKKRSAKRDETKEKLKEEEKLLLQQVKSALKKDLGNLNAGIPIPKETLEVLGKLAVNYFKQGALTVEALVDKMYNALKDDVEGIDKKQIRDLISQYEPLTIERETSRLTKKAERLEDKIIPPTVKTKKGKFAGVSEPTDFSKKVKKVLNFRSNNEWLKAQQRVANAEYKIKVLKRQAFESKKNFYQKALMRAGRLVRLSILSGKAVLYKLSAAAIIGGAIKRIPEQAAGAIWSQVFKGISEKAPIEGINSWANAKSEATFYKEFFNPKKFGENAWSILKTGQSNLSKRLGSAEYEHVPILYLPTDLHQIIKDPVKRAAFEASFRNGLIHAEKNGLDITHPLIINSIENAAFKRANYEIFQESNWLSRKFKGWKAEMDKNGNLGATGKFVADFMIPISTVPTNIARRVATTSPFGLIRGGVKVLNAYRKGIENLSNDEADAVMRQLKQGTLGTALWLVGWFGVAHYGGLYNQFNPDKKREEGDLKSDQMEVDGEMIDKPVQHALPFDVIQTAATARRIYESSISDKVNKKTGEVTKGDNDFQAVLKSALGTIGAQLENIPVIETPVHLVESTINPYEATKLKEDMERRVEPQILRETGVIPPNTKKTKEKSSSNQQKYPQESDNGKPEKYTQGDETKKGKPEKYTQSQ